MAESGGFEPPVRFNTYDSLANCWFKPLTQLSRIVQETIAAFQSDANINDNSLYKQNWQANIWLKLNC